MANEMLQAARREAESLLSALSKNPDFRKLQQVQRLIAVYEAFEQDEEASDKRVAPESPAGIGRESAPLSSGPRAGSKVAQVDEVVTRYFQERGKRASSGEILPYVQSAGIQMLGQVPSKTLSSFLSNSKRFNNVKGLGYGLVEWGDDPGPKAKQNERSKEVSFDLLKENEPPEGGSEAGGVRPSPIGSHMNPGRSYD